MFFVVFNGFIELTTRLHPYNITLNITFYITFRAYRIVKKRFQKLLYNYTFPSQTLPPFMMRSPSGEILIGTTAPKSGDIYLLGEKGFITIDPVIRGNTPFDLQIIDPDQGTSLLIGAGKHLKNWLLSK